MSLNDLYSLVTNDTDKMSQYRIKLWETVQFDNIFDCRCKLPHNNCYVHKFQQYSVFMPVDISL